MRRRRETIVMAIGVAIHAILPILPMIAMCVLQSLKMKMIRRRIKDAAGERV
jgi:hypothetical protein